MKTRSLYVTGLLFLITSVSSAVMAADYNKGLKHELDDVEQMYPKRQRVASQGDNAESTKIEITKVKAQEIQAAPSSQAGSVVVNQNQPQQFQQAQGQPIYILQQQPTTNVEANTVRETKADVLRKQREEVERQNEMKLIEKLEDERLNAEKDRAERIYNNPQPKPEPTPAPVTQQQQAPVPVVVAPQPEVIQPAPQPVAAVQTIKIEEVKEEKKEDKTRFSIGVMGGIGSYTSVSNVSGAYAIGGLVEADLANRISIEGDVTYSSYDVKNANASSYYSYYSYNTALVTTLNQWNIDGVIKYKFLRGTLTPVAGAILGFTRRDYSDRVNYGYSNSATGSNAFDGGLMAGLDVRASDNLTVGADVRYLMNISYRTDNPLAYGVGNSSYIGSVPLESLSYAIMSLNTKLSF